MVRIEQHIDQQAHQKPPDEPVTEEVLVEIIDLRIVLADEPELRQRIEKTQTDETDRLTGIPEPSEEELIELENEQESDEQDDDEQNTEDSSDKIDPLGQYMKEAGRVPLLTPEEEVQLAITIETGRFAREKLANSNHLSSKKRTKLIHDIDEGKRAFDALVNANGRLVISVAKKYLGYGVEFLDLIDEGNIGLLRAALKFDYHLGHKFSTYATWWIRQAVTRAIADQGRTIRVPVHMGDHIMRMLRIQHTLTQELGRSPTREETADEMKVSVKKIEVMTKYARGTLSLDTPTNEEEDSTIGDFIEDENAPLPEEHAQQSGLHNELEAVLDTLPPREARVLRLRNGLFDGTSYTLEEVGAKMGITRERVRQIEAQALHRLRHPSHSRRLRDYAPEDNGKIHIPQKPIKTQTESTQESYIREDTISPEYSEDCKHDLVSAVLGSSITFKDNTRGALNRQLYEELKSLPERHARVLILREQLTLEEIGTEMGISRERVRQIEAQAKKELHNVHFYGRCDANSTSNT